MEEIIVTSGKKLIPEPQCELLGPVSLLIQSCLGLIAMSSLVLKRYYEHPKRPWKIWFFDVSKQVFGALGVHLVNLTVSLLKTKHLLALLKFVVLENGNNNNNDDDDDIGNECDWYFVNLLMDTTIGVPILYGCLFVVYSICDYFRVRNIESGNYGNPPRYSSYFKQLAIFFVSLMMTKVIVYLLLFIPIFIMYADWILSWSDSMPNVQIVLVMLVFPVMLNCFQYYIVDNLIKFPADLK